ncbi:uncharacterized protein N0V89_012427 [Didymosphaeria variabile]|uniref:X-Pro dipeptidyl-peptidase n=1 Tax=Didymosphaeria variabile TaxID=1932322 RepID=A0A9W9C4F9_9PLEO|nr:uncharacterized protein N0V89_012427 [Didymosphaeria variabile]KAJ4344683.1 hypothetical protein N0V89_012427 [Didymosphaeria variabile]
MMAAFNVTHLQDFGYNETTDFGDPEDPRWSARPYVHADFETGTGPFSQQSVTNRVQEIAREQPYSELAEVEAALDEAWADGTAQKRSRAGPIPHYRRFIIASSDRYVASPQSPKGGEISERIEDRIMRVQWDLKNLQDFWKVRSSPHRSERLQKYLDAELKVLEWMPFQGYDQNERIDYLLLKNFLRNQLSQVQRDAELDSKVLTFLGGIFPLRMANMIEARQRVDDLDHQRAAASLVECTNRMILAKDLILNKKETAEPIVAFRATKNLEEFGVHWQEWYSFYDGYDPLFPYWISEPYPKLQKALQDLIDTIKKVCLGLQTNDEDTIIGEPIGRAGILEALDVELIPYTPEELIEIGRKEYAWCEAEMEKAADALGFQDWRSALEHVKNLYVEPGKQPSLVRDLTKEANEYIRKHDSATIPPIAEETIQTFMMSPKAQKMNPFFLGGDEIIVSYPTPTMSHEQKLMSLRGNNIHFARATVFHEMIPGHHLHMHYMARIRPYRQLFQTPFCIEGWAFYWEMILWDSPTWHKTPENRIGMLFWRMHRCARIIFSLKYHLGEMTAEECVQLLIDMVGHERYTAEGEVRRSVMGDYGPLYQAGYMLGGLQIYALRKEAVEKGIWSEKEFHDAFLRANQLNIELFRALILGIELHEDYKSQWKFYEEIKQD